MEQSASLPGSVLPSRRPLRRVRSRALRAALRARAALIVFSTICRPSEGFSSRNSASLALTVVSTRVRISVLPSLRLGLALELRVAQLHRDERREALAHVLAGEVLLLLLEEVLLARVVVDRAREGGAEARQMSAALRRVDVVGEREDGLVVGRVPLHGDLDLAVVGLVLEEDDAAVDRVLVAVDVGDEVLDAAGILERRRLAVGALVVEHDAQVLGEEGGLAQALREDAEVEVDLLEDVGVGHERDRRARRRLLVALLLLLELGHGRAALEALVPVIAVGVDVELEPLGERVDDRDADAVQAAGHLVAAAAELAAGVQHREDDLGRRLVVLLHDADRDAAPVVDVGDGVVGVDGDGDRGAVPGDGFVDRVVDHLVHEVMQTAGPGGTDVHARSFADRLEALEDLDVLGGVARLLHATSQGQPFTQRRRDGRRWWAVSTGRLGGPCASIPERGPWKRPGGGVENRRKASLFMVDGRPARGGSGAALPRRLREPPGWPRADARRRPGPRPRWAAARSAG